ncbi:MAG: amidase family protein [Bacillota bacterium]
MGRTCSELVGEDVTIPRLQEMMDSGRLTSVELTWLYLERIAQYDGEGPAINSVLELNPDAVHIAGVRDLQRERGRILGPLHGIPVLLKDNIDTGDRMHTSAGTLALRESRAPRDSFVAHQLRRAGAVILGKTNLTEMANFMTEGMPNGYSSRGGQVLNPYAPGEFDVGGSSAGSGAAVACDFTTVALGTETSGSILSPASRNSVVGIKPTVGLVSRTGIIPISHSQDTAGPIARTVTDAAVLVGAMAGADRRDPATWGSRGREDYCEFLESGRLDGVCIGVAREFLGGLENHQLELVERAAAVLKDLGAAMVDAVAISAEKGKWQSPVLVYEFKPALNAYLRSLDLRVPVHSLRELIDYNFERAPATMKYGQTILLRSEATSGTLTEPDYIRARSEDLRKARDEGIDRVMREQELDAILFAGNAGAAIAARAGYPSITVPGGYDREGLPLGITFTARAYEEPVLIRVAYAFEQATRHREPPELD